MKYLKKWAIIFAIYFVSAFSTLYITGLIFDTEVISFVANFWVGILMVGILYQICRTIFKSSSYIRRKYHLFFSNFYFKKEYPQINFNDFSTKRLKRMCDIRRNKKIFPVPDIPLLSDEDVDRYYKELFVLLGKELVEKSKDLAVATANLAIHTIEATAAVAGGVAKGVEVAGKGMKALGSGSSGGGAEPYKSGLTTGAEGQVRRYNSELKKYQEKYDELMRSPNASDHAYARKIYLPMIEEARRGISDWNDTLRKNQERDSHR